MSEGSQKSGLKKLVDDAKMWQWLVWCAVAALSVSWSVYSWASNQDPGVRIVVAVLGAAAASIAFFFITWATHHYLGWPKTHPIENDPPGNKTDFVPADKMYPPSVRQDSPAPRLDVSKMGSGGFQNLLAQQPLLESELRVEFADRGSDVVAFVRNPQAEPKSGFTLWIDDLQKYSPEAGFHPVEEFASVAKPCKMVLSAGSMPLYHDKKQIYLVMAGSTDRRTRVQYDVRGTRQAISVGAGTWRLRIRLEYQGRSQAHEVFVRWDGARTPAVVTTDPTKA